MSTPLPPSLADDKICDDDGTAFDVSGNVMEINFSCCTPHKTIIGLFGTSVGAAGIGFLFALFYSYGNQSRLVLSLFSGAFLIAFAIGIASIAYWDDKFSGYTCGGEKKFDEAFKTKYLSAFYLAIVGSSLSFVASAVTLFDIMRNKENSNTGTMISDNPVYNFQSLVF